MDVASHRVLVHSAQRYDLPEIGKSRSYETVTEQYSPGGELGASR